MNIFARKDTNTASWREHLSFVHQAARKQNCAKEINSQNYSSHNFRKC